MQTPKKTAKNRGKDNKKLVFLRSLILLVGLAIWTACSFVVSGVVMSFIMLMFFGAEFYNNNILSAAYSIIYYVLSAVLAILFPILIGQKWKKTKNKKGELRVGLGLRGLPTWTDIGLAPVGLIATFLITAGLTALFSFFPWFNATEEQSLIFSFSTNGLERILTFIPLVIVAPVIEELVFRGWLYGKLREKSSEIFSEIWSIIISGFLTSLVFGIMHGQWNVGITVFAMSIIMCGLREITGTIYVGILVHFLKNGLAFFLIYFS